MRLSRPEKRGGSRELMSATRVSLLATCAASRVRLLLMALVSAGLKIRVNRMFADTPGFCAQDNAFHQSRLF